MPYKNAEEQKAAQQRWYKENKGKTVGKSRASRQANRIWLAEQKRQPCVDCESMWPSYVMEYHHRDPSIKVMPIARALQNRSRQFVIEEIAKCDLLCANCHRIRTHGDTAVTNVEIRPDGSRLIKVELTTEVTATATMNME